MKALSIRQPWAWLIVRPDLATAEQRAEAAAAGLIKDIENRTWKTRFRGRFLVHAAGGMTRMEYDLWSAWVHQRIGAIELPHSEQLLRGGIIGSVELVDCVEDSDSPWYMGDSGLVLRDARPLPFTPIKGRLGFFETGLYDSEI